MQKITKFIGWRSRFLLKNMTAINDIWRENILSCDSIKRTLRRFQGASTIVVRLIKSIPQISTGTTTTRNPSQFVTQWVSAPLGQGCTELVERFNNEPIEVFKAIRKYNNGIMFTELISLWWQRENVPLSKSKTVKTRHYRSIKKTL